MRVDDRVTAAARGARRIGPSRGTRSRSANSRPSTWPMPCTHMASGRSLTLAGSFCRSAPDAALRGFMKAASPRSMRSSFMRLNAVDRVVHLAADLDDVRRMVVAQAERHVVEREQLLGDGLADHTRATRRADGEPPVAVHAVDGGAVDLELAHPADRGARRRARAARARPTPAGRRSLKTLSSDIIGSRCSNGGNASSSGAPTCWVGESGVLQLRERRLERLELAERARRTRRRTSRGRTGRSSGSARRGRSARARRAGPEPRRVSPRRSRGRSLPTDCDTDGRLCQPSVAMFDPVIS